MQILEKIHTLKIPFTTPVSPDKTIIRPVYGTLDFEEEITRIDNGIKGDDEIIFDSIENTN